MENIPKTPAIVTGDSKHLLAGFDQHKKSPEESPGNDFEYNNQSTG